MVPGGQPSGNFLVPTVIESVRPPRLSGEPPSTATRMAGALGRSVVAAAGTRRAAGLSTTAADLNESGGRPLPAPVQLFMAGSVANHRAMGSWNDVKQ